MKLAFAVLMACGIVSAQSVSPPPIGGSVVACVGDPGDTAAPFPAVCVSAAGANYACKTSPRCTLAAHWQAQAGATATPAGSSGQVQYNNGAGGLGADAGFAYNSGTNSVGIKGTIVSGQAGVAAGKVTLNGSTSGSAAFEVAADGSTVALDKAFSSIGLTDASTTAKPTCALAIRGRIWIEKGTTGVADVGYACIKNGADAYAWQALW